MPSFSVSYLNSKAKLDDSLYLGVSIDTEGQEIAGLDCYLYVSSYLQIQTYIPTSLLPNPNYYNISGSLIMFSQLTKVDGANFVGAGQIATLKCKALKKGTANLKFQFALGNGTDCNLASTTGTDILTAVKNGRIVII